MTAAIASATIAAMLALGLPTVALAGETPVDPATTSTETAKTDAGTEATEQTSTEAPVEEPASEPPAEPPVEEPKTEAPVEEPATEEPKTEPPAENQQAPPADEATVPPADDLGPGLITPMAVYPADTANCTTNCANLTITNDVNGGTAGPNDWDLHAIRSSNSDNYNFVSGVTRSVPRNATYTLYADAAPAGYVLQDFTCTTGGSGGGDPTWNEGARTVTYSNTNGSPTQKFANCTFEWEFIEPATITVQVGGDRTGPASVSGLGDVQLELWTNVGGAPGAPVGQPWSVCTSTAAGVCTFTVPQPTGATYFVIQRTPPNDVPGGWFSNDTLAIGTSPASAPYRFITAAVTSGSSQTSQANFMIATGNDNNRASGGIWQNSRNNPPGVQQCGIDVALIIDLSGSVAPYETQLKNAAKGFVDALTGTPSRVGIFTFNNVAPASVGSNLGITAVSTPAGGNTVKNHIDGFGTPVEATNWDRGISQVAASGVSYDLAVILTDGNPTVYGNDEGPGNRTRFREVENGIFSANAVKALGTRMVAVGVGAGIGGSPDNLVAISGPTVNSDYYQTDDYAEAGTALRNLALGDCEGSVSVVKQVVAAGTTGEQKTGATPTPGWEFTAQTSSPGVTPASQDGLTDGTGAVNFPLQFATSGTTGSVNITETVQPGYSIVTTGGQNAVCSRLDNGASVPVTNIGATGFTVGVDPTVAVTCTVWNRPPQPQADVTVEKQWVVNGQTFPNGSQPVGISAGLLLDGSAQDWGTTRTGFTSGGTVQINETPVQFGNRDLCRVVSSRVTQANGAGVDAALPYSPTLNAGANTYRITNTIQCDAQLTLEKSVANGTSPVTSWVLDAVAPGGALPGPNGASGTPGATAPVTPNVRYVLTESGDPRYVQTLTEGAEPTPPATGSWFCVQVDAQGNVIPGFADGANGGVIVFLGLRVKCTAVNQTALLTLIKDTTNEDGIPGDPSAWNLTATPSDTPSVPGLAPANTTSGGIVMVRPGHAYTISESGGLPGWEQTGIQCRVGNSGPFVDTDTITLPALGAGTCIVSNDPIPPKIRLVKEVVGSSVSPTNWMLSATPLGGTPVGPVAGTTGGYVEIEAGLPITLAESTSLPDADQFLPGVWNCTLNGVPGANNGTSLPALDPGDQADCVVTNTLRPVVPTITKTAAVPVPQANGSWNITYDIVATNPSAFASLTYSLEDQLEFGSSVTVNSASYQRITPTLGALTAWTVPFADVQEFTGEPALAPNSSHTWQVTVNATVAPGANFGGTSPTACDGGTPGTVGFLNTATMTVNETPYEASDCVLPVKPTIVKVGGTAVDNNNGTWTLPYTITVTNPSATTGVIYDLEDELDLPASVTITDGPDIISVPPGVTPVAGWNGGSNTLLADDVSLAGGAAAHVYQITVTVDIDAEDGAYRCPSDAGLNNTATLVSGNQEQDATGCVQVLPPTITHVKSVVPGSVTQAADGTWSIQYRIDVTNGGAIGGPYSLEDELHFGAGIDLTGATYAVTLNGGPAPLPWAGSGDLVVDRYLAGAGSDVWLITVSGIAVEGPELTPAQTACPADDADGAFNNAGLLTVGGVTTPDTACDAPSAPTVVKSGATAAQQPDASWNVSYTVTVDNSHPGAKPSYYSLTDTPAFASGVVYNTVSINGAAPVAYPGGPITLATSVPILAGDTAVYTLTFNVTVPAGLPAGDRECDAEVGPGKGFFNSVLLTSGEIERESDDCTSIEEGGRPTVEKDDPTVTQDGDGLWTLVYDITVTGNSDFVSTYTLSDTLNFGPSIDIESAEWSGEGDTGEWVDPEADPTEVIVGPAPKVIGIDAVHTYTVTVTANVDAAAFEDPTTLTCDATEEEPNVGFLNTATLTSDGVPQSDTGCDTPARPIISKTTDGEVTAVGDGFEATYEITVTNSSADLQVVYDLIDEPDFAGAVTITDREVTSGDVTVNPAWNGASPTSDVIVEDQPLAGGATHTFVVTIAFTVGEAQDDPSLVCEGEGGQGLLNTATVVSGGSWSDDACFDVPVLVEVLKDWVIDGGEPIAWNDPDLPDGFTAQGTIDGTNVDWGVEEGPFAIGDEVAVGETDVTVPEGCIVVNPNDNGSGTYTLDATVNTYTITNEVECTQTVNLEKIVDNQYGGDGVAADWTVSASAADDGFGGAGTASGPVELNVGYTLNEVSVLWENGVEYEVDATWTCTSPQGEDAFTLVSTPGAVSATLTVTQLGATVDCTIENVDIPPTLELVKTVEPAEIAADYPPTLWTLTATDGDVVALEGQGTAGPAELEANTAYLLGESADFPFWELFEPGPWVCVVTNDGDAPADLAVDVLTLEPGQQVRCDITNTAPEFDVQIEKAAELAEGETAVESGDEFEWVLTVTNLADAVDGLLVTDQIDPTLEVTGPATFSPGAGWTQTSGPTDSAFAAEYTGIYPEGLVTEIRIPVRMLPEPPIVTPPAVDPNAPPPDVPPLDDTPIPNEACVEFPDPLTAEGDGIDCAEAEVPVKRVAPAAYVRCIADVPWLYFNVQATDNVEPGDITVTWTSADGSLTQVDTIPWDARDGRLLWPGAEVDGNGVPFEFPGWRPVTEADLADPSSVVPGTRFLDLILDETTPTFPWRGETYTPSGDPANPWIITKEPLSVTFSVNPSQTVLAAYPQALPTCAIERPPLLDIEKTSSVTTAKPGSTFDYTLQVTSTGIGAADPVTLFDEIPADLKVDAITTEPAPAFPRWENCEVTGKDGAGYGGALRCDLLGVLGPNITTAPPVTLKVTLRPTAKVTSIVNTGEVCYGNQDFPDDPIVCADSSVTVSVPQPMAATGFAGGPWVWAGAGLLLLGGIAVVIAISRRRRGDAAG
ncbi:hypothetical protein [Agromyces sp. LHK192]|uniref:hypothetical protein n=1 Tax=Agromyces sp. LHK192 TaxID=2498704 RepID=UPI000FDBB150|nr:hypothetical protein [Agromyces sp. LHK192]